MARTLVVPAKFVFPTDFADYWQIEGRTLGCIKGRVLTVMSDFRSVWKVLFSNHSQLEGKPRTLENRRARHAPVLFRHPSVAAFAERLVR
jgi:hypothetical protein